MTPARRSQPSEQEHQCPVLVVSVLANRPVRRLATGSALKLFAFCADNFYKSEGRAESTASRVVAREGAGKM